MRRLLSALAIAAAAVVAIVLTAGGEDHYTIRMQLANAGGLREKSPVVNGGVPIGVVKLSAARDHVDVELEIEKRYAPIGKDAVAGVVAQNVIGQKQVRLQPGDRSHPAPDGYVLPAGQVLETTDLDQLLSSFDPDTRTRLAILINETGSAFAGRKMDFRSFLRDFAPALDAGGEVLHRLTGDNRALTNMVETSDRFIAELAAQRTHFARMLDNAGQAADTAAARGSRLRETLRRAPGALRSTRTFLTELRRTTGPLAESARLVTRTAPSLSAVLTRIAPFERDAGPTIRELEPLGPILDRTGRKTSRMLTRLVATTADLKALSENETPPVGATLNGSVDNLFATMDNWAHAIQFRDGLGHVFRGEFSYSPDAVDSLINRLIPPRERTRDRARTKRPAALAPAPATTDAPKAGSPKLKVPKPELPPLPDAGGVIDGVLDRLPSNGVARKGGSDMNYLLDYLFGGGD